MNIESILPSGSFLSASHFYGVVLEYSDETVLFYQDAYGENESGFMEIPKSDLVSDIESSEHVEVKKRTL